MDEEDISQLIQKEYYEGIENSDVKIGIIGEIGISKDFTDEREKSLLEPPEQLPRQVFPYQFICLAGKD